MKSILKNRVNAVSPYIQKKGINFKHKPFHVWTAIGGAIANSHYPIRLLHKIVFNIEIPRICTYKYEARLRFVQPWSLSFDTWPDYMFYEIIPFFWDVWPETFDKVDKWLKKYNVRTVIFTSSQVADRFHRIFPQMNIIAVTEGIDVETYKEGRLLKDREIDFLSYGRDIDNIVKYDLDDKIKVVKGKIPKGPILLTFEQLLENLGNSKIVAAYPKSWTHPEKAGEIETLTQRYWECMLSRCIMIGHAPKELVDLIGYNPVVEIDKEHADEQVLDILAHIEDYQPLVDKNRMAALEYGDWTYSMRKVAEFFENIGYKVYINE